MTDSVVLDREKLSHQYGFAEQNFFSQKISKINIENYKNSFLMDFDSLDQGKVSREYAVSE